MTKEATIRAELAEILELVRDLEALRDDVDDPAILNRELRRLKKQFAELALRWASGR